MVDELRKLASVNIYRRVSLLSLQNLILFALERVYHLGGFICKSREKDMNVLSLWTLAY